MKTKRKVTNILKLVGVLFIILYITIGALFYYNQEKLFFGPTKLDANYKFDFEGDFEEINIVTEDGIRLNNLLFTIDNSKGVIFYLHGNAGSLEDFGKQASIYTDISYDVFMADYRGFGKSEGYFSSENQIHQDNQLLYDELKKSYTQQNIVVIGYSLGTSFATKIASSNNPKLLIIQAPFYNFIDIMYDSSAIANIFPFGLVSKYSFKTNEFIQNCKMPVLIFHGDADKIVYSGSSLKLKEHFKPVDKLIILEGENRQTITDNIRYQKEIKNLFCELKTNA